MTTVVDALLGSYARLVGADASLGSSDCHYEGESRRRRVGVWHRQCCSDPHWQQGRVVAAAKSPKIVVDVSGW
jgi:hypothetical protein